MATRTVDVVLSFKDQFTGKMNAATQSMIRQANQIKRTGNQIKSLGKSIEKTGSMLTQKISTPIGLVGAASVKTAMDFEAGMSKVQAISGASTKQVESLTAKAKEMGLQTKYSATESAQAMQYMAMAGWKTEEMLAGLDGIMYLAGSSGEDLAMVSDIVTDGLTAFGLSAGESGRFADVLAAAASNSNTNVAMMGETFKYAAPVAGALGYTVEDTAKAIGLMANAGIKSSQAGTAMRSWMTRMAKPTKQSAQAMKDLNISITDSSGKMKPLSSVMGDMRKKFQGLTKEQKAQYAAMLAGQEGMSGLLAVVNASDKDYRKLSNAVGDCTDVAKNQYEVMNNNLQGAVYKMKSAVEACGLSIGQALTPTIKSAAEHTQKFAESFNSLSPETQQAIVKIGAFTAAAGPMLLITGKTTKMIGGTVTSVGKFGKSLERMRGPAKEAGKILKEIEMPKWTMPAPLVSGFGRLRTAAGKASAPIKTLNSKLLGSLGSKANIAGNAVHRLGGRFLSTAKSTAIYNRAAKIAHAVTAPLGKAFSWLLSPIKKLPGVFAGAGKAIFTVIGPAGTVVAVLGVMAAAGVLIYKNWDKVRDSAKKLGKAIISAFKASGIDIEKLRKNAVKMKENVTSAFGLVGKSGKSMWKTLKPVAKLISGTFVAAITAGFRIIVGAGAGLLSGISAVAVGLTKVFKGIIKFITGTFTGNWKKAWSGVRDIFGGIFKSLVGLAKAPINGVIGAFNSFTRSVNEKAAKIPGIKHFVHIPAIPMLARGTRNWIGGPAMINEAGGEIVDLPRGTRVYPHDESVRIARREGKGNVINVTIAKIADTVVVKEKEDADDLAEETAKRLIFALDNM